MKELLLLRHAKSSWAEPGREDFDRPLNRRGRRAAIQIGKWLADQGIQPKLILCSASRRTRETLDLLQDGLGARIPLHIEPGLYLADAPALLARVRQVDAAVPSVLVIAHNPGMHELASELADAPGAADTLLRARLHQKFPTAALARFRLKLDDWRRLSTDAESGAVKLLTLVTPADLAVPD
jgi:phosphohistidine phosphatase